MQYVIVKNEREQLKSTAQLTEDQIIQNSLSGFTPVSGKQTMESLVYIFVIYAFIEATYTCLPVRSVYMNATFMFISQNIFQI